MSNISKINQLINKICHRTKTADADTSVCLEDNTTIPSKKNKTKITSLQKRLLWCLVGVVLLFAGYLWWRMPPRMRVIAVIPGDGIQEGYEFTPVGLYRFYQPESSNKSSVLALYGWDGNLRWSTQWSENPAVLKDKWNACSSDGHYAAVTIREKEGIHVFSWHDGKLLGKAFFSNDEILSKPEIYLRLFITNSGRVWLYYGNLTYNYKIIKAIDGIHMASGRMPLRNHIDSNKRVYENKLFFNVNSEMIAENQGKGVQYWNLKVEKEKVSIRYSQVFNNYYFWHENWGIIRDKKYNIYSLSGNLIYKTAPGYKGYILDGMNILILQHQQYLPNPDYSFLDPSTKKQWSVSSKEYLEPKCGTLDGKHVLFMKMNISENIRSIIDFLSDSMNIHIHSGLYIIHSELALYNNNGIQEAAFPVDMTEIRGKFTHSGVEYRFDNYFALSPDGQRIGATCSRGKDDEWCYVILGR